MLVGASCQAAIIGSHLPVWGIGGARAADRHLRDRHVHALGDLARASTSLPRALSRVSSYDYLSTTGVIPLGNVLVGLAAATFGLFPSLYGMSAIGIVVALLVLRLPSVRHLPRGVTPSESSA